MTVYSDNGHVIQVDVSIGIMHKLDRSTKIYSGVIKSLGATLLSKADARDILNTPAKKQDFRVD